MPILNALSIFFIAFVCEVIDSTLGGGYGTILTPILLLFGYSPLEIVPAILVSELFSGVAGGITHHRHGNVHFSIKKRKPSLHLKVVFTLVASSIMGAICSVTIATKIPAFYTKLYIGSLVVVMGLLIIFFIDRVFKFSWLKIASLGLIASFNKGLTGGGYGPVVASGQLLSGVEGKNAVGTTTLGEGITCSLGIALYLLSENKGVSWGLAPLLVLASIIPVWLSARIVKKIPARSMKMAIGVLTILLGSITLLKLFTGK